MSNTNNPEYVFADKAGIEDDDKSYEAPILRQYNYRLETGTVGTDDTNISHILYNINRMEKFSELDPDDFDLDEDLDEDEDEENELDEAWGEMIFMLSDTKVHLNDFLDIFEEKLDPGTMKKVITAVMDATRTLRDVREETDVEKVCTALQTVYKNLLDIVPSVLALDDQAAGRV